MKRFGLSLLVSVSVAASVSCSKPYTSNNPTSIVTDPSEKLGCVMAAISRNKTVEPHFRTYEFIFKSKDSALSKLSMLYRADYGLLTLPEDDQWYKDFDENDFAGVLYMRTVPAGTYYADKAKFIGQAVQLESPKNEPQPFDVQAGYCTYIGELRVTPVIGKGLMGHETLKSAHVEVVDSSARDIPLYKKMYPDLDPAKVKVEILTEDKSRLGTSSSTPTKG